ncbi:MAG: hypothetical protein E7Z88_02940 [Cyanobacteria bacterium SIG27]|nr:hypothetical protein [Cyanobacteria bacterium SIG27]
MFLKFINS